MKIFSAANIIKSIDWKGNLTELLQDQRLAFVDFSNKIININPPIQMTFHNPPSDCHIKTGFKNNDEIFIVKVASGFYQNATIGQAFGDGVVLVCSQKTGKIQYILHDEGFLTTLRTALAACIAI